MSEPIKIDSGIPIPPKCPTNGRWHRESKYPFAKLEVGQSFFKSGKYSGGILSMAKKQAPGYKFTSRKVVESGVAGVRLWRIA